ncbi:DciA family protein [Pseudidiomarina sp. E22-M8]|uniref:DciA family protein n=1 Tax=Pseudidiomarina sp. E22-M8 TaxID=3424768 RepID=UPI00403C0CD2
MPRRRPKKLDQLLGSQRLQQFADFTEQHQRWQQLLRDCFEKQPLQQLLPHCEVLAVRPPSLILQVSSAAVAQRLKTEQGRIITYFQTHAMATVTSLEIRIRPSRNVKSTDTTPAPAKVAVKESDTVRKLREQAELCDEPLRSQLLALADKYSSP